MTVSHNYKSLVFGGEFFELEPVEPLQSDFALIHITELNNEMPSSGN